MTERHFHVCQNCHHVWSHDPAEITPVNRKAEHRCAKCESGPYFVALTTRREASDFVRFLRGPCRDVPQKAESAS